MIGEATLAMNLGAGIQDIAETIHAHPTLSEGFSEAAMDAKGEAINIIPRRKIVV
jgi:dihydrolipoamide dehydrogenase